MHHTGAPLPAATLSPGFHNPTTTQKAQMFRTLALPSLTELRKWCAYALVLAVPGSFVVLPVFWLVRHLAVGPRAEKRN
jgi:hypothetical protein